MSSRAIVLRISRLLTVIGCFSIFLMGGSLVLPVSWQEHNDLQFDRSWQPICWGYSLTAQTLGLDTISLQQARNLAQEHHLDLCTSEAPDMIEGSDLRDFRFFAQPIDVPRLRTILAGNSSDMSHLVWFPFASERWNPYFTLPPGALICNDSPTEKKIEATYGREGWTCWKRVISDLHYISVRKSMSPCGVSIQKRVIGVNGIKYAAFDYLVSFGHNDLYRFQILPAGPVLYCGKLSPSFSPRDVGIREQ